MTNDTPVNSKISLVIDNQTYIRIVSTKYSVKLWCASLELTDEEKIAAEGNIIEAVTVKPENDLSNKVKKDKITNIDYPPEVTTETEQLDSIEGEEQQTFLIRSVQDPQDKKEISLYDAIEKKIIIPESGIYRSTNGKEIPIPIAMTEGKITVEYQKTIRTKETKSTLGIITLKTLKESEETIETVIDVKSNKVLSKEDAQVNGILNEDLGLFLNTETGDKTSIDDAIQSGFIITTMREAEEITEVYAIRGIVDRKRMKIITFPEALHCGIIDKDNGVFIDTSTNEKLNFPEALARGFLKANKVENPNSLEVEPSNRMVIDKTNVIKKKIFGSLKVIKAFKEASRKEE
ncbi:DgyrCDS5250 [Dimorphilus gyrociliatus]|uniref:DgyrCDS5250 n=1 Tax=Dimorphilus gyrociliatus TaxID=2664684 RepID=A0A7I8VKY0_9ANNE|nr:DgyrCDS5250 [Dimorphilus gyrociliatus]